MYKIKLKMSVMTLAAITKCLNLVTIPLSKNAMMTQAN